MSQPFVGEVRLVGFNFAPVGWSSCQGQLVSISENDTLFNLIGTTYGGDGQSTFAMPDLQGRLPIHQGNNGVSSYVMGEVGGVENVTLTLNQYANHTHALIASSNSTSGLSNPTNAVVGTGLTAYGNKTPTAPMSTAMVGVSTGGNQPHDNMQPYLTLNWIISLFGIYPSQN